MASRIRFMNEIQTPNGFLLKPSTHCENCGSPIHSARAQALAIGPNCERVIMARKPVRNAYGQFAHEPTKARILRDIARYELGHTA